MKSLIILKNDFDFIIDLTSYDNIICVERGCLFAIEHGIKPDYALGDFDSVSKNELQLIKQKISNLEIMPCEKDLTDTEAAILKAKHKKIDVYGGIYGNRAEHFLSNITKLKKYHNLRFIDNNSDCFCLLPGIHNLNSDGYKYFSFSTIGEVKGFTITDFKYQIIKPRNFDDFTSSVSNEFLPKIEGKIKFDSGLLVIIRSKLN